MAHSCTSAALMREELRSHMEGTTQKAGSGVTGLVKEKQSLTNPNDQCPGNQYRSDA